MLTADTLLWPVGIAAGSDIESDGVHAQVEVFL